MNRREILKSLAQCAAGITTARIVTAAPSPDSARLETVWRMARETPAQAWASRSGAGSTLIYFGDGPAFEVRFPNGNPSITTRALTVAELEDLHQYQSEPYRPNRIGSVLCDGKFRLRGWIYNGRHAREWIMSAEQV